MSFEAAKKENPTMEEDNSKSTQLGDEEVSLNHCIASLGSGEEQTPTAEAARCDIFNNHEEAVPGVVPQASAGAGARFPGLNAGDNKWIPLQFKIV